MDYNSDKYQQSIDWLFMQLPMFSRVGAAAYKPGLDTSIALDNYFGNPHRSFKSIHVAGTNGKGSVSHSLAAVLQSQRYKTGLYTSPHLADFRERIRVNGQKIPQEAVTDFVERFKAAGYDGHPSFFELTMMMAFDWFAKAGVDYAVIEVGMGGRLDSTNIITPQACVITNISKDHTQFLGETLEAIAGEKAGIIKPGIPVLIGEAKGRVKQVFEEKAEAVNAPISFARECADLPSVDNLTNVVLPGGLTFAYDLKGDYQHANLRTVLAAIEMLRRVGISISYEAEAEGLANVCYLTGLAGRWMKLSDFPLTIADTGHNEAGLKYNMAQLQRLKDEVIGRHLLIVAGFVADKDVDNILPLFPKDARYFFTKAQIPRAMDIDTLEQKAAAAGLHGECYPSVIEAYNAAIEQTNPNDLIFIGGSTFIVADLLLALERDLI
ncbi:MAG: bifunctional folylpolyglutamate synthase/dihydrofolate synthase [Prevotella sp.]|nr:bifunctional folylpolyglutamate synthase/dihydrofolate synthase [Prevotella sp.]MCM1074304.1 bifunctional folylpolyglutamate synthase/dihydrofolate synthase [Ruminococcus sp.]